MSLADMTRIRVSRSRNVKMIVSRRPAKVRPKARNRGSDFSLVRISDSDVPFDLPLAELHMKCN